MKWPKRLSERFSSFLKGFFSFSSGERKGLLALLPLLLVVGIVIFVGRRPAGDRNLEMLADARQEAGDARGYYGERRASRTGGGYRTNEAVSESECQACEAARTGVYYDVNEDRSSERNAAVGFRDSFRELFVFDPNTIDLEGFCRLGFTKREAAGILSYRKAGKVFHDEYDFAGCYQVSLAMFKRLQNYIVIGDRYRRVGTDARSMGRGHSWTMPCKEEEGEANPTAVGTPTAEKPASHNAPGDSVGKLFDPNVLDTTGFVALGFSPRQAEVIVAYRDKIGGFATPEQFARCYVVSEEAFASLSPYIVIAPKPAVEPTRVDINRADSATLCTVHGIGPTTAGRIVALRKRLGGFVSVDQLALVEGITERNFETMSKEIFASPDGITKIDINFATPVEMDHPYITGTMLRKILKTRQLKGGWTSIEDMVKQDIMTAEQAARLAPYLIFTPAQQH